MEESLFDFDSQYKELLANDINDQSIELNITRENEKEINDIKIFSIFFDCSEDTINNINNSILFDDLKSILNHETQQIPPDIELFHFRFDETFEDYDLLIQMARASVQKLHLSMNDDGFQKSFFNMRESVTKLLLLLRCNYQQINENQLKRIRIILGTFDSITNFNLLHISHSSESNITNSSNYHLLHGIIEWRWIYVTTLYKIDYFKGYIGSENADSVTEIKLFIFDLVVLSLSKFQKCNNANSTLTTPFICSCVKQIWLLLYEFIKKLQDNSIDFWESISEAVEYLATGKSLYEKYLKNILLRGSNFIICRNSDQFSLWMISGIIKLIGGHELQLLQDRQSYELYERVIKKFLNKDQTEENMRVLMLTISEVLLIVWQPKSDILMLLWEHFHKKINSPFLINGQHFMAASNSSAISLLEQIKKQQNTLVSKLNANLTSFNLFIYTLGKLVEKFTENDQKVQIQRILGRIYTKFPATKLGQLNEIGINNFLRLLITVSVSTNLNEIASKVTDTLLQIPLEKPNHQQLIMRGHIAMLILYCENAINISQYLTKLMSQINHLIQRPSNFSNALKVLSESINFIIFRSMNEKIDIFENGEDLLIDSWIIKYLQNCTTVEQDRLYESLNKIILKMLEKHKSSLISNEICTITIKLFHLFFPFVKQNFDKSESVWMSEMVANLCLLVLETNANTKDKDIPKFENLFKIFADTYSSNLEQSMKFITVILRNCQDTQKIDTLLIMQNWIRFSVLLGGSNNELKELTKLVVNLYDFSSLCNTSFTKTQEFLDAKEPLVIFINDIGKKYSESNDIQKYQLIEKVHLFLSNFEKWSLPILQQQHQNTSQKSFKTTISSMEESIMRIYTFIAITFLHCSELVFIRTKSNCFFNVSVSHFILPSTLMMGQVPTRSMIASVYKVWPLLIEGTSRLNYKNDQHINKVLSDIIIKWAPLLKLNSNSKIVAKPFISVTNFKNHDLIEFFWTKLSKSFLALMPGRKVNLHCCMILTIIEEVLHVIEDDEKRLMALWRGITQQIIEMAMLLDDIDPTQKTCFGLIERLIKNKNFENSSIMKEHIMKSLNQITETSLSYHTVLYFKFLTKFAKLQTTLVKNLLPHLKIQIKKIEQLRGSGRDVKLRSFYEQLQSECQM